MKAREQEEAAEREREKEREERELEQRKREVLKLVQEVCKCLPFHVFFLLTVSSALLFPCPKEIDVLFFFSATR